MNIKGDDWAGNQWEVREGKRGWRENMIEVHSMHI
jgi:hypothetical protein